MKLLLALLLATVAGLAPINGQTVPNAVPIPSSAGVQFFDSTGAPLAGGKLFTYLAGTTTPQATYTDPTASVANTNPIILDSLGRAQVWIGPNSYKFVLQDAASVIQWTQDNIVDTVLYFLNFVKTAGTAALITYNPPNAQTQTTVDAELTALTSSPYTNLKLNCGAKGDGSTDDTTAIANCLSNHGIVFAPPGTYCAQSQVVIPNKTKLLGAGRGDGGGPNTVFKACNGFPINTAVVSLCSTPGPCFGVQVENLTIDCNNISGCTGGYNAFSQEQSWFKKVLFENFSNTGLWLDGLPPYGTGAAQYAQQNSGPYQDLELLPGTAAITGTVCFHATLPPAWRGLLNATCNAAGYTSLPTNAILIEGVAPGAIEHIHIENWAKGIVLGSASYATSDVFVADVETGPGTTDAVVILGPSPNTQNITISGVQASQSGANVIRDTCNGIVLAAATAGAGFYATGYGACGAQTIFTTRKDIPLNFQTSLNLLKNFTISGTNSLADDAKFCFGPGAPYCIYAHESNTPGVPGLVVKTDQLGQLIQNASLTHGATGGGLHMVGGCYLNDAACAVLEAGVTSDGGTFTARATSAAVMTFLDGAFNFYSDTGLTPGNTYTPTLRFQWLTSGHFQVASGGTYSFNGNNGVTLTKTMGSCTVVVNGGVITSITGC